MFKREWNCILGKWARMHNVLLCYLRQWDVKVYLMCHVHWLNTKYMVAISNHHLLYWFVSSGAVIKKSIDLLSLFAYGLFINFTHCFLFPDYNFNVFFFLLRRAWSSKKLEKRNKLTNKGMKPSAAYCYFLLSDKGCVMNGQQGEKTEKNSEIVKLETSL